MNHFNFYSILMSGSDENIQTPNGIRFVTCANYVGSL